MIAKPDDDPFYLHAGTLGSISDYPALGTLAGRRTWCYNACFHRDKEQLSIDGRVADESQFAEEVEEESQFSAPEIVVPHGLPAEESDAPRAGDIVYMIYVTRQN